MKIRIALFIVVISVLTVRSARAQGSLPPVPAAPPNGTYVLDQLDWLTPEQETSLNSTISRLDADGVAEMAVVTLNDCGPDKEAFRKSIFDSWGIGHRDDNDGLLILVCWYDGDSSRRSVEQLYGPGWRWTLSPVTTDQIAQEEFAPAFQQNKPGHGLVGMVREYNVLLRTQNTSGNPLTALSLSVKRNAENIFLFSCVFVMIVARLARDKFAPQSLRERFQRDYDRDVDGGSSDGFDGGRSDGGGGSSTRF